MIFNMGGNNVEEFNANSVKYGESNVGVALNVLEDELTANGKRIYLDYKDGKYGYNTSAKRGADTFSPFKSGGDSEYTNLTTVFSVAGNKLPTITGSGYITLRRTDVNNASNVLNVYIDGNTEPFKVYIEISQYGVRGGFLRLYFQESIRFSEAPDYSAFFYQTLLADKLVDKKYNITQGKTNGSDYTTITGKGKIVVSPSGGSPEIYYSLDGSIEQSLRFYGYQCMEFMFNKSFKFKSNTYISYYIAYTEL